MMRHVLTLGIILVVSLQIYQISPEKQHVDFIMTPGTEHNQNYSLNDREDTHGFYNFTKKVDRSSFPVRLVN